MRIGTNISSMISNRSLQQTNANMNDSLKKLSTGKRIVSASDDAAGLAISEKMRKQMGVVNQSIKNAQNGVSMLQTAEGALNEIHGILQRMNELTNQGANDTNSASDRAFIETELASLGSEITNIATNTKFNGTALLDGTFTDKNIQIGASATEVVQGTIDAVDGATLGVAALSVTDTATAVTSTATISTAIDTVSTQRSNVGALQNRLEYTTSNLSVQNENLAAAESRIRDADMAEEMATFTKNQILQQAGISMLAQANQQPQAVMKLLG